MSVIVVFNVYGSENQHKSFESESDAQEWVITQEEVAEINNFQFVSMVSA